MTELARKQLLHAKHKWPKMIHVSLWPYALRNAAHVYNNLPNSKHGMSPLEAFSDSKISPNVNTHHTFGCPTYVLRNELQNNNSLPRCESRARVGINLGYLPRHSSNVFLVLNPLTGLMSPQFHLQFDELFDSVQPNQQISSLQSNWQKLAGFSINKSIPEIESNYRSQNPLGINITPVQTREENNNNVESTVDPPAENDTAQTLPPTTGLRGRPRRQTPPSLSSEPDPPPPHLSVDMVAFERSRPECKRRCVSRLSHLH